MIKKSPVSYVSVYFYLPRQQLNLLVLLPIDVGSDIDLKLRQWNERLTLLGSLAAALAIRSKFSAVKYGDKQLNGSDLIEVSRL